MAHFKVLVLGGTGPAGICLLRELVHRSLPTVVYARNPSKIPTALSTNPFLKIIKGDMDDVDALSHAMQGCSVVLSLLGPRITDRRIDPALFANIYKSSLFPTMRKLGIRRIFAMGTLSIKRPEDSWTIMQTMTSLFMPFLASAVYENMLNVANAFEHDAQGLDWTIFRLVQVKGESDQASWEKRRLDGEVYTGWLGSEGWTSAIDRAALAQWLADAAEGKMDFWIGKMPAVSRRHGS